METNHHGGQAMPYGVPRMSSCKILKPTKLITVIMTCGNEKFYCTLFVNKLLLLLYYTGCEPHIGAGLEHE